jgi:hypothetical protein
MATAEVKNLAGLNDIQKLLLHEMAVLNRKMQKRRLGPNRWGDCEKIGITKWGQPLTCTMTRVTTFNRRAGVK